MTNIRFKIFGEKAAARREEAAALGRRSQDDVIVAAHLKTRTEQKAKENGELEEAVARAEEKLEKV